MTTYDLELSQADYIAIRDAAIRENMAIGHFIRQTTRETVCTNGSLERDNLIRPSASVFLLKAA